MRESRSGADGGPHGAVRVRAHLVEGLLRDACVDLGVLLLVLLEDLSGAQSHCESRVPLAVLVVVANRLASTFAG